MSTIKDVAQVSGISVGTISRYLNGYNVKPENQEKIEKAIEELNYRVNPIARGLKTNKSFTIGIIVPSITDVFANQVIEGVEDILERENYSIIICSSRNRLKTEKEKLSFLKEKRVDGIVMMPVSDESKHVNEFIEEDIPLILIDRLLEEVKCDGVVCDNVNGSYHAMEELIRYGHRRIGIIAGPENVYTARERLNGYKRSLNDYQISIDEELIQYAKYEKNGGLEGYENLMNLSNPPTAIFATNYETTMTGIKYFMERGIKIGEDISFFGYDNTDIFQMLTPSISTVVQPMNEIGEEAAKLLLSRIEGNFTIHPIIQRLKTRLLLGSSVKKIF
ncbi:LacI family DNA-binding transcriptional regulator [Clostridium sp. D2Q-11]|uniref:LacI family DNA-binding transcriptional regulator n=2 Tax=Anaeromonas frigoriresistens TaxID=2683708 RepID=A0A942URH7_9FIRM|nr:LacI family DNA-binding transcriptional regulator [Anaeromonas frigoriresistens]